MQVYRGSWSCIEDVESSFNLPAGHLKKLKIIVAAYDYGSGGYEGYAFVLFKKDRKFYEVNGSHCSCYGLEDQWAPEQVSVAALKYRIANGKLHDLVDGKDLVLR